MRTMNASVFKAECLRILDEVKETGETVVILKRGKPVARVVPPVEETEKPWLALAGTGRFVGDPFAPAVEASEVDALR